jgi:FAD synthase
LLRESGLDNLIIVEFTREFAEITSGSFVEEYLVGLLNAKVIVVGFNHFFGHNKEGDFSSLEGMASRLGFITEMIPGQEVQNETVSSTEIRKSLREGFIQRVNAYLDHYYMVIADVLPLPLMVSGKIAFALLATDEDDKLLPPAGAYAVTVIGGTSEARGIGVITSDMAGAGKLYLGLFEGKNILSWQVESVRINFHRRMSAPFNSSLFKDDPLFIESVACEVEDLIY